MSPMKSTTKPSTKNITQIKNHASGSVETQPKSKASNVREGSRVPTANNRKGPNAIKAPDTIRIAPMMFSARMSRYASQRLRRL